MRFLKISWVAVLSAGLLGTGVGCAKILDFYGLGDQTDEDALVIKGAILGGALGVGVLTVTCFNCHTESTETGNLVRWARDGHLHSAHWAGLEEPVFTTYTGAAAPAAGNQYCYPYDTTGTNVPANTCYTIAGFEREGSRVASQNSGGGSYCAACHTHQGFIDQVSAKFGGTPFNWSEIHYNFSLNSSTYLVDKPAPLGCFTCHAPHTNGDFRLRIPNGQATVIEGGYTYDKAKGSTCTACHTMRAMKTASKNVTTGGGYVLDYHKNSNLTSTSSITLHQSQQTHMLLGKGGAEWSPSTDFATGKSLTYTSSAHATNTNANCITCHMALDVDVTGVGSARGGHAMSITSSYLGVMGANTKGCATSGCHDSSAIKAGSVLGSGATGNNMNYSGQKQIGDYYVTKGAGCAITSTTACGVFNGLLTLLADPTASCGGLLANAAGAGAVGATLTWSKGGPGGAVLHGCTPATVSLTKDALATPASAKVNWFMAMYNYGFVRYDRSFANHNSKYAIQLLYDSCVALKTISSGAQDCTLGGRVDPFVPDASAAARPVSF